MIELRYVLVVFCCFQDDEVVVNLAEALNREGISSFRFDFSGNGYALCRIC